MNKKIEVSKTTYEVYINGTNWFIPEKNELQYIFTILGIWVASGKRANEHLYLKIRRVSLEGKNA